MFDPKPYLERLDRIVDSQHVKVAEQRQERSWRCQPVDRLPTIVSCNEDMSHILHGVPPDWPVFGYREVLTDPGKMLVDELRQVYEGALLKDDRAYSIRANYGSVIIPFLLGCNYYQVGDEMPWTEPLASLEEVREVIKAGVPDRRAGLGARVEETELYYLEALDGYENLRATVHVGCPDTQSPFNLASSIMGPAIFLAMHDHAELVHDLLQLVTDTYIAFTWFHKEMVKERPEVGYQMGWYVRGGARVVDDAATNISKEMYQEFCVPYNTQITRVFGGAMGHFCGAGCQILEAMLDTEGITAINFGNPELQDFELVYQETRSRQVCLLWDGPLPVHESAITTGLVWKRIATNWAEAQALANTLGRGE